MTILIKNGHVIDPLTGKDGKYDVLIEEDRIISVEENIRKQADRKKTAADGKVNAGWD